MLHVLQSGDLGIRHLHARIVRTTVHWSALTSLALCLTRLCLYLHLVATLLSRHASLYVLLRQV